MGESLSAFCHRQNLTTLLAQWDAQANLPLTPETIPFGSTQKVWWQCEKGHRWQVTVNNRTSSHTDCPYCSGRAAWPGETDLASQFPELAREWHPTKNLPLTPECVLPGSEKKVWWRCGLGHVWRATVHSRTDGCGCPVCANRAVAPGVNDLASQFPKLAQEWHPTKNGALTPQEVTFGTKRKVWWRCEKGHEWYVSVQSRTLDGTGCPVCAGRVILPGENDMASQFPEVAREWHPTKIDFCCRPKSRHPANGGSGGSAPRGMNMWPQWGCEPTGTPVAPTVPGKKSWPNSMTWPRRSRKSRRSGIPR